MKKFLLSVWVFLLFGMIIVSCGSGVKAANEGIQISPLTYNFEILPGQTKAAKVIVKNLSNEVLNYVCETENFSNVSDQGAPSFSAVSNESGVTSLAEWINFDQNKEGTIQPKKDKEIIFNISVPRGAEPGGHYAAVFAKQIKKNAEGKTELGVASRVGTLILVSVPGDTTKGIAVSNFVSPSFLSKGPASFSMDIKNTGTVHFDSTATAEIQSVFGTKTEVDLGTHTIIPRNQRAYSGQWNKKYPFGYFKVNAYATDGDGNKLLVGAATLWAVPFEIVIPVLLGLILILLLVQYLKKHIRFVPTHEVKKRRAEKKAHKKAKKEARSKK